MEADDEARGFERLDLTPSPRLLEVLGDIPYKPWQCLAELVDNAFDNFLSNPDQTEVPRVDITLPRPTTGEDALVCVRDNGRGMSREQLEHALKAGYSSNSRFGSLGLFGMGFNIATARLGLVTEVRSTRAGDADWLVTMIDFREMQSTGSFSVPLRRERKDDRDDHGTEVTVRRLKPELRNALTRKNTTTTVIEQLGRVYSYLLRSQHPILEVPDTAMAGRGFALYVNNRPVKPRLPCVWSASRYARVRGEEVNAVQPIDFNLPSAVACTACGHWQKINIGTCVECGSDALETRERRIHGWLGVQRYLDSSDYGIDFLRNGRKILLADKSMFVWENQDTGETLIEYPIEIPANQGRLVGEIHLDHVAVNYQKTDFDRTSSDWGNAVVLIRGEGPLQPEKARQRNYPENRTALGRLFKAYRRNDPGEKSLIPGDGEKAIHDQARKWGDLFHQQLPEYLTDEKWFGAAVTHDAIRDGRGAGRRHGAVSATSPAGAVLDGSDTLGGRTGLDATPPATSVPQPPSPTAPTTGVAAPTDTAPPVAAALGGGTVSRDVLFDAYRRAGHKLFDLEGDINVGDFGKCSITVWATTVRLTAGTRQVPVESRPLRGNTWEIFVDTDHPVFRDYGRDPRDYAVMEIVNILQTRATSRRSGPSAIDGMPNIAELAAQVVRQFPELRVTDAALRERATGLLARIRELARPTADKYPAELWSLLSPDSKQAAERTAATADAKLDWQAATLDGAFVSFLDARALAGLVRERPDLFLDGVVFDTRWSTWNDDAAKRRQVTRVARLLDNLGEFVSDPGRHRQSELSLARLTIDMLFDELTRPE